MKYDFENIDGQLPGCPSRGCGLGNWCVAMLETNGLMKNMFANEIIQVSNENQFCFPMLHKNFSQTFSNFHSPSVKSKQFNILFANSITSEQQTRHPVLIVV